MARLRVVGIEDASGEAGVSYPLTKREMTLGRADGCDIVLTDRAVSRRHARLVQTPEGFVLEDAGSATGVFVNGSRVKRHRLVDGSIVRLGGTTLEYLEGPSARATGALSSTVVPAVLLLGAFAVLTFSLAAGLVLWQRRGARSPAPSVAPAATPSPIPGRMEAAPPLDADTLLLLGQEYLREAASATGESRDQTLEKAVQTFCTASEMSPGDIRISEALADALARRQTSNVPGP